MKQTYANILMANCICAISFGVTQAGWKIGLDGVFHHPTCSTISMTSLVLSSNNPTPKIPGDPQRVVRTFHKLFNGLVGFRKTHGRLPHFNELKDFSRPISPGISLSAADFRNPDVGLPEDPAWKPSRMEARYAIKYELARPNGKQKPAFPAKGERDLWISTENQYTREAFVNGPDGKKFKYYGVVVGLFSDGTVEVEPINKMIGVQVQRNMIYAAFPDETGLPAKRLTFPALSNKVYKETVRRIKPGKPL